MFVPKIRSGSFEEHKSLVPDCIQTSDVSPQRFATRCAREGACCRKYVRNPIPEFFHGVVRRVALNIGVEGNPNLRTKYEIRADHSTVTFCDVELRPSKSIHSHNPGSLTSIGGGLVRTDY